MLNNSLRPRKAYFNVNFLSSPDARTVRLLCEYLEPMRRFREERVKDTIVFYGSARTKEPEIAERELATINERLRLRPTDESLRSQLIRAEANLKMSRYYDDARTLASILTKWSTSIPGPRRRYLVCSGGGPGIMEAANRGAAEAGGKTVGLTISLPTEEQGNEYISPELAFEFHYFFMRKYWFVYMARALCVFPGGFGTLDELMDVLTLLQTRKIRRRLPIVMYGTEYWNDFMNLDALVKWGTISPGDLDLLQFADTPEEAFRHLTESLAGKTRKMHVND